MAALSVTQTQTILPDNTFQVVDEVIGATDMPMEVFVFTTETQEFSRVATVYDLEHRLYTSYEDALAHADEYYRLDTVSKRFTTQAKALAFATYTLDRLRTLVGDYTEYSEGFEGTQTYEIPEV